jgi:hypothetical protein
LHRLFSSLFYVLFIIFFIIFFLIFFSDFFTQSHEESILVQYNLLIIKMIIKMHALLWKYSSRILLISLKSCGYITCKKSCVFQRYSGYDSVRSIKNNIKKSVTLFSFDNHLTILLLLFFVLCNDILKES